MTNLLELDGGGIKGITQAIILAEIEKRTHRRICDIFNLITGTSTGAIIGGCLAAGIQAERLVSFYKNDGPRLFTPRQRWMPGNWFKPKYDREPFIKRMREILGDAKLSALHTYFIATAFGLSANRTHFIKSTDPRDKDLRLVDVISWSALSAAGYFGNMNVLQYYWKHTTPSGSVNIYRGETFADGGQGVVNCSLCFLLMEILASGLDRQGPVNIISIGTGDADIYVPYSKTSRINFAGEILDYFSQARDESTTQQVNAAYFISSKRRGINFIRLNLTIEKKLDKLDAIDHLSDFESNAETVIKSEQFGRVFNILQM